MKNFIIFLYFVFLFKLVTAESTSNLPGIEPSAGVGTASPYAPSYNNLPPVDEDVSEWQNPDAGISEADIPTIALPKEQNEITEMPPAKVRKNDINSAGVAQPQMPNENSEIVDPFKKQQADDNFEELKPEQVDIRDNKIRSIEKSEQFPETPELEFTGKKIKKQQTERELTPEEREKQVDDLLNSVMGESKEEQLSPEDLLEPKPENAASEQGENLGVTESTEQTTQQLDFNDVRKRADYYSRTYSEAELIDQLVKSSMSGDKQTVIKLLHSGRKANSANRFGETPLMGAIFNGHNDIVEVLLAEGANPNAVDLKGNTPLHVAVARQNFPAVQYLIRSGANIDPRNRSYDTPLLIATLNNSFDMVDMLVREGADVNKGNGDGLTPLHIAAYNNNIEIVKYLLYVGANANMVTKEGLKPYDLAYGRNVDIARLLLTYTNSQRYTSNDLQSQIKQKNLPVASPQPQVPMGDQLSMFPQTYVEAEQQAIQEEQVQDQNQWWAFKQEEQNTNTAQQIMDETVYNKSTTTLSENVEQSNSLEQESLENIYPQDQSSEFGQLPLSMQRPKPASEEISLDSEQIKQQPRHVPASMKTRQGQVGNTAGGGAMNADENFRRFSNSLTPSKVKKILHGNRNSQYSDMSIEQKKKWDARLEKWIKKSESLTSINKQGLDKYKKQGEILQLVYGSQFGMNIEKVRQEMAYQRHLQTQFSNIATAAGNVQGVEIEIDATKNIKPAKLQQGKSINFISENSAGLTEQSSRTQPKNPFRFNTEKNSFKSASAFN